MPERPGTLTTTQLARVLILTERRVQRLVRSGVLKHAYDQDDGHELRGRFLWFESIQILSAIYVPSLVRRTSPRAAIWIAEVEEWPRWLARRSYGSMFFAANCTGPRTSSSLWPTEIARSVSGSWQSRVGLPGYWSAKLIRLRSPASSTPKTFAVLDELSSYDPAAFNEQNEAYLATFFPEAPAAKPNGNGESESEAEALESDAEYVKLRTSLVRSNTLALRYAERAHSCRDRRLPAEGFTRSV